MIKRDISADIALGRKQFESDDEEEFGEDVGDSSSACSCNSCLREGAEVSQVRNFDNNPNAHPN